MFIVVGATYFSALNEALGAETDARLTPSFLSSCCMRPALIWIFAAAAASDF